MRTGDDYNAKTLSRAQQTRILTPTAQARMLCFQVRNVGDLRPGPTSRPLPSVVNSKCGVSAGGTGRKKGPGESLGQGSRRKCLPIPQLLTGGKKSGGGKKTPISIFGKLLNQKQWPWGKPGPRKKWGLTSGLGVPKEVNPG